MNYGVGFLMLNTLLNCSIRLLRPAAELRASELAYLNLVSYSTLFQLYNVRVSGVTYEDELCIIEHWNDFNCLRKSASFVCKKLE
ncbi:unnamed protein product [Heligmosomoides polygyrus]|uniref:Secreted protein n=1 Tax=Heligmosomoides polygyrus TaxID=6339 RepID=A0A183GQL0_HELPZ|nr:unnamed protein product [Heligmosomoides polygyrus]